MASATQLPGPMEVSSRGTATPAQKEAHFNLAITLTLFLWPSLSLAVSNNWGGPDSSSKREMFASAAIDLLHDNPDADEEWIEEFLVQVMLDEFEVAVDDGSAGEVADQIVKWRGECLRGEFEGVRRLQERWVARGGREVVGGGFQEGKGEEDGSSEDDDDEDEDDGDEEDVDMDEAPQLVRQREAVVPEVDEDGFTKVTKKKR